MEIESRPSDHPVDLDPPGSATRFFEPVGELAAFAGDIALSGTRYGIAVGGFVAMSYAVHAAYFRIPFSTLLSRQDIRVAVLSMGVGVLIGIIRAVRDERLGTGAVTVRSVSSAIQRPLHASVTPGPDRED